MSEQFKILVADDMPRNVRVLRDRLRAEGYAVVEASNGEEALEQVAAERPDLVLLDIMMPGLNGYDVCERLKSHSDTRMIPVVMVTALTEKKERVKALDVGADDFITKPVDPSELRARMKALLRSKSLYDELQQRYVELQKLEIARETLTQMIAHDLRNPLAALIGHMNFLKRRGFVSSSERAQRSLHAIDMCSQTLIDMVTAMQDLARLEAGELVLKLVPVNVKSVLSDVEVGMQSLLAPKKLSLVVDVPETLPLVQADRECLRRMLANLVGNAVNFSPEGGVVEISAREADGRVCLAVRDEGPGIAPADQARIFEKFGQVESQQSGQKYATGLGLAFCKMAVEAHNGEVGVKSEVGKGATFAVYIPKAD